MIEVQCDVSIIIVWGVMSPAQCHIHEMISEICAETILTILLGNLNDYRFKYEPTIFY